MVPFIIICFATKKDQSSYQFRRIELSEQIRQVYEESNQIYGAKKIKAVLASRGIAVSDKMVAELLNEIFEAPPARLILWQSNPNDKKPEWTAHGVKWVDNYVDDLWDMGMIKNKA